MPDGSRGTLLARTLVGRGRRARRAPGRVASRRRGAGRDRAPPGVGKSRLVRELASWAQTNGGLVLTGRCSPTGQDTPLRPWREALLAAARAGRTPAARPRRRSCPRWRGWCPSGATAADDASALVLGEAVLRLLSSWATPSTTTLLVVEDLHWADPESLAVLEYVVDNLAGAPLLVVATLPRRRAGRRGRPGRRPDRPAGRRRACGSSR